MNVRARWAVARLWAIGCVLSLVLPAAILGAQDPPPPESLHEEAPPSGPPVTVEGEVVNAATGQPLPRALVRMDNLGALTDGDGRFRIPGVPSGDQSFNVIKPGFIDQMEGTEGDLARWFSHSVRVGAGMPALHFALAPDDAIFGHITLSTGVPAQGIGLMLVKQNIVNGRAFWSEDGKHYTSPDGAFRFSGLQDGTYLLLTEPESDNGQPLEPACNAQAPAELQGFASEFFNNTQDLAGATRISLSGGKTAEANLALNVTRFHFVQIAVAHVPVGAQWQFSHELQDRTGRTMPYPVHEEQNHALCAYLPDGTYRLSVSVWGNAENSGPDATPQNLAARLEFTVDGQPARNLRVTLGQAAVTPIHVHYEPKPPPPPKAANGDDDDEHGGGPDLQIGGLPVNAVQGQDRSTLDAEEKSDLLYELESAPPGQYWIHAVAGGKGVCVGDVSSGGQNLARAPWVAGTSGAGTPIEVTLRTDCAKLTVQMGTALAAGGLGEGAIVHVYAVPLFDSVAAADSTQIAPLADRTATIEDLTPGTYRVYAFRSQRDLEFRNPAAMAALGSGQEVTVEPGGSHTVVLQEVLP